MESKNFYRTAPIQDREEYQQASLQLRLALANKDGTRRMEQAPLHAALGSDPRGVERIIKGTIEKREQERKFKEQLEQQEREELSYVAMGGMMFHPVPKRVMEERKKKKSNDERVKDFLRENYSINKD